MGGKGVGASPETLLLSAVTACYSLTLLAYLQKRRLPCSNVEVKTEGVVTGFPQNDKYAKIIVNPAVNGGDSARQKEYQDAAAEAREHCFIGQTVAAGGVAYELGSVTISTIA
jgi:organic hydroperoxide reductase OsmC/OhrA